jgi:adenosine deaminase
MAIIMQHLALSLDDIKRHILHAAEAAFLPDDERKKLIQRLKLELYPDPQVEPASTTR